MSPIGRKRGGDDPGELPDELKRALGALPKEVQDAIGGLPPEAHQALAGLPPEALEAIEGVETTGGEQTSMGAAQIVGGPQTKLELRFAREAYRPGDAIEGTIVAREQFKARSISAELCYVEQSPDYVEQSVHDTAMLPSRGTLETGAELPFSFQMPPGALPNWDPAGISAALTGSQAPSTSGAALGLAAYGRLYWAVVVKGARRLRTNLVERHPVPLDPEPTAWPGPAPAGEPEESASVKGWDVELGLDHWTPRRGEEVTAAVRVGKPAADRDTIQVGLVCEIHYDVEVETTSTDNDGMTTTSTSRSTRLATAHEQWAPVDPGSPLQEVRLRIPADAPFSYGKGKAKKAGGFTWSSSGGRGSALAMVWKLVAREDRRMRRNPRREISLHVLP